MAEKSRVVWVVVENEKVPVAVFDHKAEATYWAKGFDQYTIWPAIAPEERK